MKRGDINMCKPNEPQPDDKNISQGGGQPGVIPTIRMSDFLKYGCPFCGCISEWQLKREAQIEKEFGDVYHSFSNPNFCSSCGKDFVVAGDKVTRSNVFMCTENGFSTPDISEHPRKGIPATVIASRKQKEK
jgi:hypothetical protein